MRILQNYKVYHGDVIEAPQNSVSLGLGGVFSICAESNAPINVSFSYLNTTLQAGVAYVRSVQRSG